MLPFDPKEFKAMEFNVFSIPKEKDLLRSMPKMKQIPEFKSCDHPDRDRLIRYVCYAYDKNSPVRHHFKSLEDKKMNAAVLAGFDPDEDSDTIDAMMRFDPNDSYGAIVLILVDGFLRFIHDNVWSMIVTNEEVFNEYRSQLLATTISDKSKELLQSLELKSKLMEQMDIIVDRLDGYYRKLYGDDEEIRKALRKKRVTPESFAK